MVKNDPKEVIMEALCTSIYPEDLRAREGTFQFFRSRLLPNAQMHEVTFKNKRGETQRFLCLAVMQSGTWYMVHTAAISDANPLLPGENTTPGLELEAAISG